MGKKGWYDAFSWIFVLIFVGITGYALFAIFNSTEALPIITFIKIAVILKPILMASAYLYGLLIVILSFIVKDKAINIIFTIIGSIIFPGILPLIVYFAYLRKKIN